MNFLSPGIAFCITFACAMTMAKLAQRLNDEINLPGLRGVSCLRRRRAASFQDIFTTLRDNSINSKHLKHLSTARLS